MTDLSHLPALDAAQIVNVNRTRMYRTPVGDLPSVTTILKVLGLGTEGLIKWAATEERKAILEACADVYAEGCEGGPADFVALVEERMGKARAHQRQLTLAADIGTSIHQSAQRRVMMDMGMQVGPEIQMVDQAQWAFMAWEDWWKSSGLKPLRAEQPIWHPHKGYAGTIDLIAEDPMRGPGIVDFKSSKAIYDTHHLQCAAYLDAARQFMEVNWVILVRVPKNLTDPAFEVKELGRLYDRTLTDEQLITAFQAALTAWNVLIRKE